MTKKMIIWFDHREGPYPWPQEWTSEQVAVECYSDDPFFIGIQAEGESPPPVVVEYYALMGEEIPA